MSHRGAEEAAALAEAQTFRDAERAKLKERIRKAIEGGVCKRDLYERFGRKDTIIRELIAEGVRPVDGHDGLAAWAKTPGAKVGTGRQDIVFWGRSK